MEKLPVSPSAAVRLVLATLIVVPSILACGSSAGASKPAAPTGSTVEIAEAVFTESGVEMWGEPVSIADDEWMEYYLGSTNYPEFASTTIVQPMISVDPRMVYVLETKTEEEAIATMEQLTEDVDPARLICVVFSLEDVRQERRGNVVFMVIDGNHAERDALADAFLAIP